MYLLDTNVVSELRKTSSGKGDSSVKSWAERVSASDLFVSVLTLEELEIGVLLAERKDPPQGAIYRRWLSHHVVPVFADRTLPVDTTIALRSAALHVPDPRPIRDALIAATALVHGLTLVTRNVSDFSPTGVEILNPWE